MSFADNIKKNGQQHIYLVVAKDSTGKLAWYFINVAPHKYRQFEKTIRTTGGLLEEFGTIIKSGYGKEPPSKVLSFMEKEYNWKPNEGGFT